MLLTEGGDEARGFGHLELLANLHLMKSISTDSTELLFDHKEKSPFFYTPTDASSFPPPLVQITRSIGRLTFSHRPAEIKKGDRDKGRSQYERAHMQQRWMSF